jgi:rSAM/selenodomain-associated transferase 1
MNGSENDKAALVVLARLPRPGRVKSRLAATLGEEAAMEVYRLCAEQLFGASERLPRQVARYLFYADPEDRAQVQQWAGRGFYYALRTVFAEGARKAVIVGSDVPDLSAAVIEEAFALLDRYPLVIGPDEGGGYYLLGMKMLYADLFERRVAWGTERVLAQTLRIMQLLELTPAFLPRLIDVDTAGDLRRWLARQEGRQDELARDLRRLGRQ